MSVDLQEFHGIFFEESSEALDDMESGLLGLEPGAADIDSVNNIFRGAHSIKGGAGMFGFNEVVSLTHILETLLDKMREGEREVSQESVDILLQAVDCLREMLQAIQAKTELEHDRIKTVQDQLQALLDNTALGTDTHIEKAEDETKSTALQWRILFRPYTNMFCTGNDPYRMFVELAEFGDLDVHADVSNVPDFSELNPEDCHLSWEIFLTADVSKEQIVSVFDWVDGDCDLSVLPIEPGMTPEQSSPPTAVAETPIAPVATASEQALPSDADTTKETGRVEQRRQGDRRKNTDRRAGKPAETNATSDSIRVDTDKIDAIVNLVGELIITQSMLSRFGENFEESDKELLSDGLNELSRHTRELQESVLQIRMLPISFSFNRFPRLVRDLSNKLGKKMQLKLQGEHTELDKTVLEKIGDPLVHLVRNSIDHGIESPETRLAAGKPEIGQISLNAYHAGGDIIIEISDDGAGLPKKKLLQKAIEKNIVGADDELSDDQIHQLIFAAGFSTAEVVSDVSGRGVGMDVVRRNIKDLGGTIDIQSEEGIGSTFRIRLPLTLAILDGQLVRVGKETYIISLVSIIESLQIDPGRLHTIAGEIEMYRVRDNYIPIIRLHKIFGIEPDSTALDKGLLVVVENEGSQVGLFIDDLLGQQQVVIKSLESNFRQVEGLSGATILGNGTVALILDVPGLLSYSISDKNNRILTETAA